MQRFLHERVAAQQHDITHERTNSTMAFVFFIRVIAVDFLAPSIEKPSIENILILACSKPIAGLSGLTYSS